METPVQTMGRIVHYRLSAQDVAEIMRRRTSAHSIARRLNQPCAAGTEEMTAWPAGAQAHIGNEVHEGEAFPMMIVRAHGTTPTSCVNGQVFLDGTDVFWALSRNVGETPGTFFWPPRV